MRHKRGQRGDSQFGCVVGVILLLAGLFVAYKMIPIKVKAAELRQVVYDESKAAGSRGDDRILAAILRKAEDLHLPVTADNVHIDRRRNDISIDVEYVVPVQYPGFTYQWKFHHHAENPMF